ncbi:MAG TPA: protocatechuate 3,4-dioxygenase subunit alpha [Patescibacteria group bacterium]|nr:protocatechuate 3,4-dioxygenase subunit alpha [Patescibacteria group bacterium]
MPTPSQTVGPFFGFALPFEGDSDAVPAGAPGSIRIEGQVIDGAGDPTPDALLEVWAGGELARCRTDAEGAFHFVVSKPAARRDASGMIHAPHLEVTVFARGLLRHLATRIYFPDEAAANDADPVLQAVDAARRGTLIARRSTGALHFDVRLQGVDETVFFAL